MAFSQFYETADSKYRKQLWSIINLNDYTSHLPIDASLVICTIIRQLTMTALSLPHEENYVAFIILTKSYLYHDNCLWFW